MEKKSVEDKNSRIKRVRTRFSLTQGQLGQKIGKTAAYINQIERGKVEPTETVINTIADVLEIDKGWLRTGEGEMMKETDLRPVGDRILQIRKEWGENQANFAEMLGVSRNAISLLECRKITVSGKIIKVLVEKYEIDENWLRTGRGEMYESEEIVRMYEILERDEDVRKMLIGFLWRRYEGELLSLQPRSTTPIPENKKTKPGQGMRRKEKDKGSRGRGENKSGCG